MSAVHQADPEDDTWVAAIHASKDDPTAVGSGIVLDERRVMTCFHVIENLQEQWVSFPKAQRNSDFIRLKVGDVIHPADPADVKDLAILVLSEPVPQGVTAAPLRFLDPGQLLDEMWWAFGFPDGDRRGSMACGKIRATLSHGWLHLRGEPTDPIKKGYSGTGLWSPNHKAVVAIVSEVGGQGDGQADGRAITLFNAAKWFPDENLHALASRQKSASGTTDTVRPAPEVMELAAELGSHPDGLALIYEIFDRILAIAPKGATVIQLLEHLDNLVQPDEGPSRLQQLREIAAQRSSAQSAKGPCLLIALRKDAYNPEILLLSLTLFLDGPGQPQLCDKEFRSLKEIQGFLKQEIPRILDARRGDPLIEFAVEADLIGTPFDQWPVVAWRAGRTNSRDCRLGEKYAVVVRDLDRMNSSIATVRNREKWEQRWKFLNACESSTAAPLHKVDLGEIALMKKESVFQAMYGAFRLPDASNKAVLVLLPEKEATLSKKRHAGTIVDILQAAVAEGIPAAIWLRHHSGRKVRDVSISDDLDDRAYLEEALSQGEANPGSPVLASNLPSHVMALRARAASFQDHQSHPARRLSLLWADPSHNLSPRDFKMPANSTNGADL